MFEFWNLKREALAFFRASTSCQPRTQIAWIGFTPSTLSFKSTLNQNVRTIMATHSDEHNTRIICSVQHFAKLKTFTIVTIKTSFWMPIYLHPENCIIRNYLASVWVKWFYVMNARAHRKWFERCESKRARFKYGGWVKMQKHGLTFCSAWCTRNIVISLANKKLFFLPSHYYDFFYSHNYLMSCEKSKVFHYLGNNTTGKCTTQHTFSGSNQCKLQNENFCI